MQAFIRLTTDPTTINYKFDAGGSALMINQHAGVWVFQKDNDGELELDDGARVKFNRVDKDTGAYDVLVTDTGDLWVAGKQSANELCSNADQPFETPTRVTSVVIGDGELLVITKDGELWVCGRNSRGQLGVGDYKNRNVLTRVHFPGHGSNYYLPLRSDDEQPVSKVSAAGYHTLAITADGQLRGAGDDLDYSYFGGEGDSTFTSFDLPTRVIHTSSASTHRVVITEKGEVWVYGNNTEGQLGVGDKDNRDDFTRVHLPEPVVNVAVSTGMTLLLTESGQVWVGGRNDLGQLGLGAVDHGGRVGLRGVKSGTSFQQLALPEPVVRIACAHYYNLLVTESGRIWASGVSELLGIHTYQFTPLPGASV